MGRDTSGVRGMDVAGKDNYVLAMDVARPGQDLLVVTENGYGKRTPIDEYRKTSRGAKGVKTITADRGQGRAGRRARRARAPGARVHLAERHGPADLGARHQPLRPRGAGRARDEPARRRHRLRRRAGGRDRRRDRALRRPGSSATDGAATVSSTAAPAHGRQRRRSDARMGPDDARDGARGAITEPDEAPELATGPMRRGCGRGAGRRDDDDLDGVIAVDPDDE